MKIEIKLKPMTINQAFQGRRFKTKKCKEYEENFLMLAPKFQKKIRGKVEIEYKFYIKNHKMADYDNMIKITQDLLVECGYIEDDRFIYKATIYKIPSEEERMEITIKAT